MPKTLPMRLDALLEPADLKVLAANARRQTYRDGDLLHSRGDSNVTMGLVVEGCVRLVRVMAGGHELIQATVQPGQHYADHILVTGSPRTHNAVAVGRTVVDHYSRDAFDNLLNNPRIALALYRIGCQRLAQALDILDDLRGVPPEVQLVKLLLMMAHSRQTDRIECRQEDLASMLGVSSVTLAKALKLLRGHHLVTTGYRSVTITDTDRAQAWLRANAWE